MIALKITDVKDFMNKLLRSDLFDSFETTEVTITTFNTFTIDGGLRKDFFDTDEWQELEENKRTCSLWKDLKPHCFSVIRGKRTPLSFKIIFQYPLGLTQSFMERHKISPDQGSRLFLNLQYRNKELLCTTGVARDTFVADKSLEQQWDQLILRYFHKKEIEFQES